MNCLHFSDKQSREKNIQRKPSEAEGVKVRGEILENGGGSPRRSVESTDLQRDSPGTAETATTGCAHTGRQTPVGYEARAWIRFPSVPLVPERRTQRKDPLGRLWGQSPSNVLLASGQMCLEFHCLCPQRLNLEVLGDHLLGQLGDLGIPAGS